MSLNDHFQALQSERERDKERWLNLNPDFCMLCHAEGQDKRAKGQS